MRALVSLRTCHDAHETQPVKATAQIQQHVHQIRKALITGSVRAMSFNVFLAANYNSTKNQQKQHIRSITFESR